MRSSAFLVLAAALLAGCRAAPAGPAERMLAIVVYGDSVVYTTSQQRSENLQVAVLDAATRAPVSGARVTWQVVGGTAALGTAQSASGSGGLASTWLGGAPEGAYRVQATVERQQGPAALLEVRVVPRPVISAVEPSNIAAGGEVTVTGSGFSPVAAENAVFFELVRGTVLAASATALRVQVPRCLPTRQVNVVAALGAVASDGRTLEVSGTGGAVLELAPGGVHTLADPAALACVRIPAAQAAAAWILVVHNVATGPAPPVRFELNGYTPHAAAVLTVQQQVPASSFADAWELELRRRERALGAMDGTAAGVHERPATPALGSRRAFNVLNRDHQFATVSAAVRAVSSRAIVYVDVEAQDGFTDEDIQHFARTFDDPIQPVLVDIFGQPSDLDRNERIIILFTPQVNLLTPRGSASFITGFFYGCDLVSRSRCAGTNRGEILYSLVPDPSGRWGDARTRTAVRAAVPPVLAHELQHMIHFARRGFSSDALWLAEGLAHLAEDLVADVFATRGEHATANLFRAGNIGRAREFLAAPAGTALLDEEPPGSLAQRGAAWLFMKHMHLHNGGNDLLRRLTGSTHRSVANVTRETGRAWEQLITDFGVALWAGDSPDMARPVERRYTFPGFSLRGAVSPIPGAFPLRPTQLPWRDLAVSSTVAAGSSAYFGIAASAQSGGPPLNLVLSGHRGAPLGTNTGVALSVVRVR